jgi:hypothetical protein
MIVIGNIIVHHDHTPTVGIRLSHNHLFLLSWANKAHNMKREFF